ncbi:MAG: HAMP domain-containing protein [Deltaproteobacteria bacterium]|nr:HAMP domain-containing protein [Deltaproteobacteria bacterium]
MKGANVFDDDKKSEPERSKMGGTDEFFYLLSDRLTKGGRKYALHAALVLLASHLTSMVAGGFSSFIGAPGANYFWPWVSTTLGILAVPLCTWVATRLLDKGVDKVFPSARGLGGAVRILIGVVLVFGVVEATAILAEAPLPFIGRTLELSTVFISIAVMTGLVFFGLGAADIVYQVSSFARYLSTRLMMLLVFAAVSTFVWLSFLGLQFRSLLFWAVEKGHLEAYVAGVEKLEEAASAWVGGLAGALSLELPFILLLAWRFGRNATRALDGLRRGFQQVGSGTFDRPVVVEGRDEVAQMQVGFNQMLKAVQERRFLETTFGRYVSPIILERLREAPERTHLVGERTVATVLFSDIRGFTKLSATMAPEEVIGLLNAYMSSMIEVIARFDGYINKFVGDAIMVVWGVPLKQEDHAKRAIDCALAMQESLREQNRLGGYEGVPLEMGIGINTGPLVAGNLGNSRQVEFTVIGDTVNVSSRCCSAADIDEIVITKEALGAIQATTHSDDESTDYHTTTKGLVPLKGKGDVELLRVEGLAK